MMLKKWRPTAAGRLRQLLLIASAAVMAAVASSPPVRSAPQLPSGGSRASSPLPKAPVARQVLLVHGLWSDGTQPWTDLRPALLNAGYTVSSIDFGSILHTNEGAITAQAAALATQISGMLAGNPDGTIDLVCHSMGGLAAREYLHEPTLWRTDSHGAPHSGVRKLIMLGTPNWGSDAWVADPVIGVLVPYVYSPTYAKDTVNKWSPALQDMYAEWMPPPTHVRGKVYQYPANYVLEPWPTNGTGYLSPVSDQSRHLAQEAIQFGILTTPAARKAVGAALKLIPAAAARRFQQHLRYYGKEEKALGPVVFPAETIHGVDGADTRHVSAFLAGLNDADTKLEGVKYYLIAGTSHFLTVQGGQTISGPYTQFDSDVVVPVKSALGIDPMTGSPLFPGASTAEFPTNHIGLPHDANVISQVVSWLGS